MVRMRIEVGGIVQGVGFRPFLHRLVSEYDFRGWVRNNSRGVDMELEGGEAELTAFAARIRPEAPLLAEVASVQTEILPTLANFAEFTIIESREGESMDTLISPDVGICNDCRRELLTPQDRRYRYPFLNCTNCGPRFTIIQSIPYDRARTSMRKFPMCGVCEGEYRDITDRRYHAEPTCCPDCGPKAFFESGETYIEGDAAVETARKLLKNGGIVCVKGLGGMHLACLPSEAAELRRRKQRDEKPFALMCRSVECAEKLAFVSEAERQVLESYRKPIVLLRKRDKTAMSKVSENAYLGVMLPYTPLHVLLMGDDIDALILTSANLSDRPILRDNDEARHELADVADGFLLHDRDILTRCDDSLLWIAEGKEYPARRSRGYVPYPVRVEGLRGNMLACGAEQKATFALSKPELAFPSQHIGDLKNFETLQSYEEQIEHFRSLFGITPDTLVCDLHPDYLSTRYAEEKSAELGAALIRVQHHHAHMASCMADNGLAGPVIGIVWDGVGYGTDGTAWGGEFLTGDFTTFERRGHIRALPLPGGDRAVKEIWRLGYAVSGEAELFPGKNTASIRKLLERGENCPPSTGMGRLFDAACAVIGLRETVTYEGQGAVLLEAAASDDEEGHYRVAIGADKVFDWEPMIREMAAERRAKQSSAVMAAKFMNTLIETAAEIAGQIAEETKLCDVMLSGGSFQNQYILSRLPEKLRRRGLRVWTHSRVSCNDEGLSLGQLVIAQARLGQKGEDHVPCHSA